MYREGLLTIGSLVLTHECHCNGMCKRNVFNEAKWTYYIKIVMHGQVLCSTYKKFFTKTLGFHNKVNRKSLNFLSLTLEVECCKPVLLPYYVKISTSTSMDSKHACRAFTHQPSKSYSFVCNALHCNILHYIILNNEILKSNSSIFPQSEGYITQYTPQGVYKLIVDENNEVNICLMIVKMI